MNKQNSFNNVKSFNELLNRKYGKPGSSEREKFETQSNSFMLAELLKMEQKKAKLTNYNIDEKIGTNKNFISKIEKGVASSIQNEYLF